MISLPNLLKIYGVDNTNKSLSTHSQDANKLAKDEQKYLRESLTKEGM